MFLSCPLRSEKQVMALVGTILRVFLYFFMFFKSYTYTLIGINRPIGGVENHPYLHYRFNRPSSKIILQIRFSSITKCCRKMFQFIIFSDPLSWFDHPVYLTSNSMFYRCDPVEGRELNKNNLLGGQFLILLLLKKSSKTNNHIGGQT